MTATVIPIRQCHRCQRPVGMLAAGRCLPYVVEAGKVQCADRSKCNLARTGRTKDQRCS